MAYPVVSAPYGLKPINLIGGQLFAGSTRMYNIQYAYNTNIFFGDYVALVRGNLERITVATGVVGTVVGVFMGCSYTNPTTKQKQFSQYWPANTTAGDAVAYVSDDPDLVFQAVVCSSGTTIASGARAMIGRNMACLNNAGNVNTGNSANALEAGSVNTTDTLPVRVIGVVPDTAVSLGTATYVTGTTTVTCSALPFALPVGTDVGSVAANGQYIASGSYVSVAAAAGDTSFTLNAAASPAFAASATLVFTQYPELLIKINFGQHEYYAATATA